MINLALAPPSIDEDWMPRASAHNLPDGYLQFSSVGQLWEAIGGQWKRIREPTREQAIKLLTDRFLAWSLPKSVCSDLCTSVHQYEGSRSGTNLLTADEARQMLEYLLG